MTDAECRSLAVTPRSPSRKEANRGRRVRDPHCVHPFAAAVRLEVIVPAEL
jgi:hypothetical protein